MKAKVAFVLVCGMVLGLALMAVIQLRRPGTEPSPETAEAGLSQTPAPSSASAIPAPATPARRPAERSHAASRTLIPEAPITNRLERLAHIRDSFRTLAAGDPATAMRAARQLVDGTEREAALLTLVAEWTQGNLGPPQMRAQAIADFGLEVGLGMELRGHPDLAVLWATELTDEPGRTALLQTVASELLASDPAAAWALSDRLAPGQQRHFADYLFASWAATDTEAAIQWANQLPTPEQRDGAMNAIRSMAPVGIGAELRVQDGYPVINQLMPNSPAALGGQLHPGDRILALAQAGTEFVNTRSLPLTDVVQMIRGAPGTQLQLQVLAADAPPGAQPRVISILRDQIKFKR